MGVMKAKATVRLQFSSEKHLAALMNALMPEASRPATKRSKVMLTRDNQFLVLAVEASDTVALRAALNAYLRWINSTVTVLNVLEGAA
jgi:tRNA threonylcarbamoyladenosine modification (KEOPS) complex  Pcc1 subunit